MDWNKVIKIDTNTEPLSGHDQAYVAIRPCFLQ